MVQPRQFVPVQGSERPRQGETQFDLSTEYSDLTSNVLKYATKHNVANMQEARGKLYLEGQIQASQGKGVAELRKNTPWYQKIFGEGASISGAMDYTVQKSVLDYTNQVDENMEAHRKMVPEAFIAQQQEQINSYLGEDEQTNQAILAAMSKAVPEAARKQAKEFKIYEQEYMFEKVSEAAASGLERVARARKNGDEDDYRAALEDLGTVIARPQGMDEDSYKSLMYQMAALESEQYGTDILSDRIEDLGLVSTIEDRANVIKTRETSAGVRAEEAAVTLGLAKSRLKLRAESDEPLETLIQEIGFLRETYGNDSFTEKEMKTVFNARAEYLKDKGEDHDKQRASDMFMSGLGARIHKAEDWKYAVGQAREGARETGDYAPYFEGLNASNRKDAALVQEYSSVFSQEPTLNKETGQYQATRGQEQLINELVQLKQDYPEVYYNHVSPEVAMGMSVYELAVRNDPTKTAGDAIVAVQAATDRREGRLSLTREEQGLVQDAVNDLVSGSMWPFGKRDAKNVSLINRAVKEKAEMYYAINGGRMEPAVEAAVASVKKEYIRIKNQYIPATAAQSTGVPAENIEDVVTRAVENEGLDMDDVLVHIHPGSGVAAVYSEDSVNQLAELDINGAWQDVQRENEIETAREAKAVNDAELAKKAEQQKLLASRYIQQSEEFREAFENRPASQQLMDEQTFLRTYMQRMTPSEIVLASDLSQIGGDNMNIVQKGYSKVKETLQNVAAFLKNPYKDSGVVLSEEQKSTLRAEGITEGTVTSAAGIVDAEMEYQDKRDTSAYNSLGGHLSNPTDREKKLILEGMKVGAVPKAAKSEWESLATKDMTPLEKDLYRNEAAVRRLYGDPKGIPTIGVGAAIAAEHVSPATKKFFFEEFGFDDSMFPPTGGDFSGWIDVRLTDDQMIRLFKENSNYFDTKLKSSYKDPAIRDALLPIVYQVGLGAAVGRGAGAWKAGQNLRKALQTDDPVMYRAAIEEYMDSDWYRTYPRAKDAVQNLVLAIGPENVG